MERLHEIEQVCNSFDADVGAPANDRQSAPRRLSIDTAADDRERTRITQRDTGSEFRPNMDRKPTTGGGLEKQPKHSKAQTLGETEAETVEERDPLANLKLLEETRPGFHWRGPKSLNALVYGTDDSNDKNRR